MGFIDEVEITCISGRGGDGCVSFLREKYVPRGGPDGGDGGRGGDLILHATSRRNTLEHLRGRRRYEAKSGRSGSPRNAHGRGGEDLVVDVPVGTQVLDPETGVVLADLTEDGQRVVICRGGKGGKGNTFFKTSSNRTPRRALPGGEAIVLAARLELKLLADVGLLGFPNAGKSTLISVVSRARPRIADYPFTTLVPNLGMVSRGWEDGFVIADIPGLVQGAAQGVGLGHRFLRHVERSRFLLHLVSAVSEGEPVEDPMERYLALRAELAAFSEDLVQRPEVVVLTKADAVLEEELSALVDRFEAACGQRPHVISAVTRRGVDALMDTCWSRLQAMIETGDQD